jgi:hypothetical protein
MTIEKRLKEKAHELAKREQKIVMYEEDLKNKAMEIKNSLISKEEEITTVKKRFLEEKRVIDLEKKKLTNSLAEAKVALDDQERKFWDYRREQDESPMAVLRAEIQNKNLQVLELESQVQKEKEKAEQANEATSLMKKQL